MAANLRKTNKCYRCGAEIEPGSRYCMECGAPLKKPHGNGMIAGVAAALVIVAVFGGNAFKKNAKEADTDTDVQTESLVSDVDFEDQMTETQETEETTQKIDADISAVDSETCTLQGTLYYTSKMEDPVLVLKDTKSVYLNSTSGKTVYSFMISKTEISFCFSRIVTLPSSRTSSVVLLSSVFIHLFAGKQCGYYKSRNQCKENQKF